MYVCVYVCVCTLPRTCSDGHDAPEGHRQLPDLKTRCPAAADAVLLGKDVGQVVEELNGHVKRKHAGGHGDAHQHGGADGGGLQEDVHEQRAQCFRKHMREEDTGVRTHHHAHVQHPWMHPRECAYGCAAKPHRRRARTQAAWAFPLPST